MTQAESLADAITGFFSNPQAGWYTPISIAVQGLTAEQAARIPAERFNSAWAVVNHVWFWQEFMLCRLQGQTVDRQALGSHKGWPPVPQNPTYEQWQEAIDSMLSANRRLAEFTSTLSDEGLHTSISEGKPTPYQVIQGLICHNAYHTCEIISIRHMQGFWLERT